MSNLVLPLLLGFEVVVGDTDGLRDGLLLVILIMGDALGGTVGVPVVGDTVDGCTVGESEDDD